MRFLLKTLAFVLLASSAQAQTSSTAATFRAQSAQSSDMRITPVLGVSTFHLKDSSGISGYKSSAMTGVWMDFGRQMAFETGLVYYEAGARSIFTNYVLEMDYISLPLVAKYSFSHNVHKTVFLKAGMMPSYLVDARVNADGRYGNVRANVKEQLREYDAIALAGVGGQIGTTQGQSILLEGTYNRGLVNLDKSSRGKTHNEGIMLTVGYTFDL